MGPDEPDPEPELTEQELDALIEQAGLELSPKERENVLTTARFLRRAAALVRAHNSAAEGPDL